MEQHQNERAFQKQPTVFLAKKGGLKKKDSRWVQNPGLGFKVPREAREGHYIDKKCPFTGKVSIRGRILTGVITKLKMNRTAVIRERGKKETFGVLGMIYAILAIGVLGFVV